MILMVLTTFILSLTVIGPSLILLGSRALKTGPVSFKKALTANLWIALFSILTIPFSMGLRALGLSTIISSVIQFILVLFIWTWVIKKKLNISVPRSLGVSSIALVMLVIFAAIVSAIGFQTFFIPRQAKSMTPTLIPGDYLIVNKYAYRFRKPVRGELITFHAPVKPPRIFVKRVVGLPGEELEIRDGKLIIEGKPLEYPMFIGKTIQHHRNSERPENYGPVKIPGDAYFVLGDDTGNSYDSRSFGSVSSDKITGKPSTIYWSTDLNTGKIRWNRFLSSIK